MVSLKTRSLLVVVKSEKHVTSIASMIEGSIARYKLLLRERKKVSGSNKMSSLKRTGGRERPA